MRGPLRHSLPCLAGLALLAGCATNHTLDCERLAAPTDCWQVALSEARACAGSEPDGELHPDGLGCTLGNGAEVTFDHAWAPPDFSGTGGPRTSPPPKEIAVSRGGKPCARLELGDAGFPPFVLETESGALSVVPIPLELRCPDGSREVPAARLECNERTPLALFSVGPTELSLLLGGAGEGRPLFSCGPARHARFAAPAANRLLGHVKVGEGGERDVWVGVAGRRPDGKPLKDGAGMDLAALERAAGPAPLGALGSSSGEFLAWSRSGGLRYRFDLPPGSYVLYARRGASPAFQRVVTMPEGNAAGLRLDIELPPGAPVEVALEGLPRVHTVELLPLEGASRRPFEGAQDALSARATITNGQARFAAVAPGWYRVAASGASPEDVEVVADRPLQLTLHPLPAMP